MAIYSAVPPPPDQAAPATPPPTNHNLTATTVTNSAIDIDSWTISALQSLSVSPVALGTGTALAIPLDDEASRTVSFAEARSYPPRRPPSRRDSQKTRDALLKGKEGSRQRRRWENDRLMHVPNVQPPQPKDWEVRPTHPVHRVPYQLAQFWDRGVRQRVEDKTIRLQVTRKKDQLKTGSATGLGVGEVPRDLRESVKRSPVVRSWIRSFEEPVRQYMCNQAQSQESDPEPEDVDSAAEEMDSDDEEIVFVGRNGAMRELRERQARWKMAHREVSQATVDSGMLFDSLGPDDSASFKRWLIHSISHYYGLESRSITLTNPSRRVVYVSIKQDARKGASALRKMPRPLWELC